MKWSSCSRRRQPARGYTMLEAIVSMIAATALLTGMASSIYIASQAFDGKTNAHLRSQASDVQADMLNDMRHATSFSVRNSTATTFTVPDRDADGMEESVSYRWAGAPTYQLTYSINSGTAIPVFDNVRAFQFSYLSRSASGVAPPPGPVDSRLWGDRWRTSGTFGYTARGSRAQTNNNKYLLARYTLTENAKVKNLCVYFTCTGVSKVRCGIYAANASNMPTTLLVQSAVVNISQTGWSTINVPVTALVPGEYFLAVSYKNNVLSHSYDRWVGNGFVKNGDATGSSGFPSSWSGGTASTQKISIYANYDLP